MYFCINRFIRLNCHINFLVTEIVSIPTSRLQDTITKKLGQTMNKKKQEMSV